MFVERNVGFIALSASEVVTLCDVVVRVWLFRVFRSNGAAETAPGSKGSGHDGPFGLTGSHEILKDTVDGVFIKDADVAIGVDVEFQ